MFSRKFCGFLLVLVVLLLISFAAMFSGSNGKELVDGEYVDEVGELQQEGEEDGGSATPSPHYESKHKREIRLRREREERKQAYLKEKEEKRLRKEEEDRVKREEQERLQREQEEAAAAAAAAAEGGDDYDEQTDEEQIEGTLNSTVTETETTLPSLSDDYYHLDDELDPDCEDNSKLGVIGGELVQVIEIPHNRNFRSSLEQWTKEDKMVRVVASKGEALKCPRNLPTASIVAGARGYGFCRTLNRTALRSVVVLRNPVHRMYAALQAKAGVNASVDDMVRDMNRTKQFPADYLKFIQRFGTEQARYLCGVECVPVGKDLYTEEEMLDKALENLDRIDVIGFADQLDKVIPQLKYLLPAVVPKQFTAFPPGTAGEWDTPIPTDVREILKAWSQVDNKVFVAGQDRFVQFNSEAKACVEGD